MAQLCIILVVHAILFIAFGRSMKQDVPNLDPNAFWGPSAWKDFQDDSVRRFRIKFDKEMIQDLRHRLHNHRNFTPGLEGANFRYGFNSDYISSWLEYWADGYPFEEREDLLNIYPQFKTRIQGLDIHFIWVRPEISSGIEVIPLLMLHGWPGSVGEFYQAIPLITAVDRSRDFVVELIVPSLPGFGFSDGAVRPGMGPAQIAVILRNLMHRLGHRRFYVQGGDFGSIVNSRMVTLYPEEILGFHTNFAVVLSPVAAFLQLLGSIYPSLVVNPANADRMYPLSRVFSFLMEETGYMHIQATKPDTVGISLSDSPAGLLAYVLEKFSTGTLGTNRDLPDGGLGSYKPDSLIDTLMFYWTTNSMTTAIRLYAETFSNAQNILGLERLPTPVPVWAVQARHEIFYQPPMILKIKYPNLLNTTVLDYGGHFMAFELPEVFSESVLTALGEFREWHAGQRYEYCSVDGDKVNWSKFFDHLYDGRPKTTGYEIFYLLVKIVQKLLSYD